MANRGSDLPVPNQNATQSSTPSRGTILIVEDDPAVRELLQLLLDDEGHRTFVAADGHKALALAAERSSAPNLVIADYNLPNGLNGLEMIASLRKQLQHEIPAIVLTGDISTDTLREIARYGCVHLNKPVKAIELTRHIQYLLAKPPSASPESAAQLPLLLEGEQASTVFVVDDDRTVREAMRDLLHENGYAVEIFADGPAFFEAYVQAAKDACWSMRSCPA